MSQSIKNSGAYQRLTSSTNELERLFKDVDEKKTPIDLKKILLLVGLGTLSWISTYSGLLELITANSGDIDYTYKLAIGFAVAMLMLMIVYILDQLFAPLNWILRTVYISGYIFLTVISVGFGFGFYWKFLESRSEATRSAESAVGQVQGALQGGQSRLEQLESTLITLTALSLEKAKVERETGKSCPNSRPGDGPRRRMRDNDAKSFTFAGDFVTRRAQAVATEIKQLNGDMIKISTRHPSTVDPTTGTRNAFMKSLNQRLDLTITRFNSFRTDPQLKSIRNNLADRANKTQFPDDNGGTFKCPDNQLQSALEGVVLAFDQLPLLEKPRISAVEGSEATIEAFRRLAATLKGLAFLKMPPSEDELRETRKRAVRSLEQKKSPLILTNVQAGLNDRDYIPLSIAIFVDFCLLLVSINRPMDRLKSLVPVMKEARDGPISGILSSFHATHFAGIREEFSLFQHVVFDWGGHYYVAVPLASNDIQAQYLANLFVSLEGRGIVDRAMIPPTIIVRSKLKKMGSSFADHRAFRLYKFRDGAWSNIVLDAVMGAAKDVAITTANQRTLDQLPGAAPITGDEGSRAPKRSANFASLFNEQSEAAEQAEIIDEENNYAPINPDQSNQPYLEMPLMLRKGNKDANSQNNQSTEQVAQYGTGPRYANQQYGNNVIKPASFNNNQPANRQTIFTRPDQNQYEQPAPQNNAAPNLAQPRNIGTKVTRFFGHNHPRPQNSLSPKSSMNFQNGNQNQPSPLHPHNPMGIRPMVVSENKNPNSINTLDQQSERVAETNTKPNQPEQHSIKNWLNGTMQENSIPENTAHNNEQLTENSQPSNMTEKQHTEDGLTNDTESADILSWPQQAPPALPSSVQAPAPTPETTTVVIDETAPETIIATEDTQSEFEAQETDTEALQQSKSELSEKIASLQKSIHSPDDIQTVSEKDELATALTEQNHYADIDDKSEAEPKTNEAQTNSETNNNLNSAYDDKNEIAHIAVNKITNWFAGENNNTAILDKKNEADEKK